MTQDDAPLGAPEPQPDAERRPLTKITRLPYLLVVIIALVVVGVVGLLTTRARQTSSQEMVGFGNDLPAAERQIEAGAAR